AGEMVAAGVSTQSAFQVGERAVLFPIGENLLFRQEEQYALYDVMPDDRRFVMLRGKNLQVVEPEFILVDQWPAEREGRR
ncbi:MAG: hypothetical protein OEW06_11800, partial [Gemmatimonadota bacterium]|nr:hypothetical protein [Gemmatimonadota bacterium]